MPTYEYLCADCKGHFTLFLSVKEHDEVAVKCPDCQSANVTQVLSVFSAQTSRKS